MYTRHYLLGHTLKIDMDTYHTCKIIHYAFYILDMFIWLKCSDMIISSYVTYIFSLRAPTLLTFTGISVQPHSSLPMSLYKYRPMAKLLRNLPNRLRSTTLPMTSGTGDLRLNEPGHRSSLRPTAYETMTTLRPPANGNRGTVKGPRPPNGTPARTQVRRHCH